VADYVEKMVKFRTRFLQAKHTWELAAVQDFFRQNTYRKSFTRRPRLSAEGRQS
jgi:hypothetical protein